MAVVINESISLSKMILDIKSSAQRYVVDLKENLRISDTKKASTVAEETFLCEMARAKNTGHPNQIVKSNSCYIFACAKYKKRPEYGFLTKLGHFSLLRYLS